MGPDPVKGRPKPGGGGAGAGGTPFSCYSRRPQQRRVWALPQPGKARLRNCVSSMNPVHWLIDTVLELYIWVIIASVVLSWLIAFNVINTRNSFVAQIRDFLYRLTEPVLAPIRNLLPSLGGIDISPIIVILLLVFLRRLLWQLFP
jgi:YggT family protein